MASESTGLSGLAGRYASALFDLADGHKVLDQVAGDLRALGAAIGATDDFARLIRSPVITAAEKGRALDAVAARMELGPLTRNFLGLVARNRRAYALPAVADAFLALLAKRRGELTAEVTAAQALSERQLAAIAEQLRRATGEKITIKLAVEPRILGGLIVKVGSRMVDGSLSTKLQRLQLAMKGI